MRRVHLAGLRYLAEATRLLQRTRREDKLAGLYEAADLHWWWREDDAADPEQQMFWYEDLGRGEEPLALLMLYQRDREWDCDFCALPSQQRAVAADVVPEVIEVLSELPGQVSITVREDDSFLKPVLEARGWRKNEGAAVQTYLEGSLPPLPGLPDGFRFESRAESAGPHPLVRKKRNPPDTEKRLRQSSLYRPDLDLAVMHSSGEVAAYALFWHDPETLVGLLEPMRTEDGFQRRGLGSALVGEGLRRLFAAGAEMVKVTYLEDNLAARRLYHRCGFRDWVRKLDYTRIETQEEQDL